MSVNVTGLNQLLNDLERQLGTQFSNEVAKEALEAGAKELAKEIDKEFVKFKDTGASMEETTIGKYENRRGVRSIRIHWKGDKERYRVIHLNEWGTSQNPRPKGFGAIARAMENSRQDYRKATEDVIRRNL
jgi:HK97 gp10 family phage protein